jgi:tetraacyldisaccharide 4'-kinase
LHDVRQVHAVAGIGNPQRFFQQLTQLGITFIAHEFPDHYHYRQQDVDFGENSLVIMTEKDAVKCRPFADRRHYCLPVCAELSTDFIMQLQHHFSIFS